MATVFNRSEASAHAIALVKAGLESGAIKLIGPSGDPEQYAADDAKYLVKLVNDLAEGIKDPKFT